MFRAGLRTFKLGTKSLLQHKLRSLLTVLGMLFGVSSVIAMLAVGEGASHEALEQLKALGPTNLMARSQKPPETQQRSQGRSWHSLSYGLTYSDVARVRAMFPHAEQIVSVRETPQNLRRGPHWSSSIVAISASGSRRWGCRLSV